MNVFSLNNQCLKIKDRAGMLLLIVFILITERYK